jgi:hypothetical protein
MTRQIKFKRFGVLKPFHKIKGDQEEALLSDRGLHKRSGHSLPSQLATEHQDSQHLSSVHYNEEGSQPLRTTTSNKWVGIMEEDGATIQPKSF